MTRRQVMIRRTARAVLALALLAGSASAQQPRRETAVFAGGCFWGIQSVFAHVKGVIESTSGFAGGTVASPDYETVSSGATGHAESVRVVFDPAQVSYAQLVDVFFAVHDPTQLNRQGPDVGSQYRTAIFAANDEQARLARAAIARLEAAHTWRSRIVTEVTTLDRFFPAEAYHQDYAEKHPNNPYIVYNDAPKVAHLRQAFPALFRETPVHSAIREASGR
jgi:peptide-methionine (S)-S-oxide reductase